MTSNDAVEPFLLAMLEGCRYANAFRKSGKPCRIQLPDNPAERKALVDLHRRGSTTSLKFCAEGGEPWSEMVQSVVLAGLCPGEDGQCRWLGFDIDGADHGERGLADPVHAVRVIAERASAAGMLSGLVVARSRRGVGRHVFLMLPEPTPLQDGVIGIASLVAAVFKVSARDVAECEAKHAFMSVKGAIATPGEAGAIELIPRSTMRPRYGWAITLPMAGAFAKQGGGLIVDPFNDRPTELEIVPKCNAEAWETFLTEAKAECRRLFRKEDPHRSRDKSRYLRKSQDALARIDARTREFLDGRVAPGSRNAAAFAAATNLLGCGVKPREAEALVLVGAERCGLPRREGQSCFRSAMKALEGKLNR